MRANTHAAQLPFLALLDEPLDEVDCVLLGVDWRRVDWLNSSGDHSSKSTRAFAIADFVSKRAPWTPPPDPEVPYEFAEGGRPIVLL